ncbi:hypothetical protein LPJ76_001754 [Coemansia sp. RSA 638]|nr:hypothetical protein LPJ76_001754 [Coemansia sp. RSA 638]
MSDSDSQQEEMPLASPPLPVRRVLTNVPDRPLPAPPVSAPSPVSAHRATPPPIPSRRMSLVSPVRYEPQSIPTRRETLPPIPTWRVTPPPIPARRTSHTANIQRASVAYRVAPPIPVRKDAQTMPVQPELIATPPLVQCEPGPECPTEGTYETIDRPAEHAKFQLDTYATPAPVHRGGFHRSVNSLPTNVPVISAPPGSDQLLATPSAPPLTARMPTFISVGHRLEPSDSGSSDGADAEPELLSRQATPSDDVRSAALDDAQANMGRAMFSDRVLNFRDLGVSVMRAGLAMHQSRTRAGRIGPMPGVVFRSAEVGSAGEHDVKTLFSKYGIRTIIDLRSELEARASDILTTHYPASMQPTSGQSDEKLARLRAAQLRNTIVEVAAHDYEAAARPWERTGETHASWSRRNSLRYSRSIGDPRRDPLARALAHLYDHDSDSDTQNVTTAEPYVPREPNHESNHESESVPELEPTPATESSVDGAALQHPGLAQSAYDWGNETLQMLRSYWDYQWPSERTSEPPAEPLPPLPPSRDETESASDNLARDSTAPANEDIAKDSTTAASYNPAKDSTASVKGNLAKSSITSGNDRTVTDDSLYKQDTPCTDDDASANGSTSTDSFYLNHTSDTNSESMHYGLRPIDNGEHNVLSESSQTAEDSADELNRKTAHRVQVQLPRATTEPSLTRLAQHHAHQRNQLSVPSVDSTRKPRVVNRFGGARTRFRCNVIGENYRKKCVWAHAPLSTKIKVVLRFATFNKAEAIRTIGREVLAPRGLAGSYEDYVDYCKQEFAAVLRIFADPCAYPILFHCQHGKDRTGIVAMLLLAILGVDDRIIAEDYALSEKCLVPVRRRMELLDMGAVGLPPAFCESPAPVMLNLLRHIRANYGSVHGYLRSAGLSDQELATIAWCLRGNFCGIAPPHTRLSQPPGLASNSSAHDNS